ncbi:hypothetical protein V1511DRAFT_505632 [Dipodascopsis uninucleata]
MKSNHVFRLDIESLQHELNILHLVVHRNKNQHHLACWWKYLSIIHRNLNKIITYYADDLTRRSENKRSVSRKSELTKRKNSRTTDQDSKGTDLNNSGILLAEERAEYLVFRVIPKAYKAFNRLIAQRQYVALGLVLVASTSKIWSLLRADENIFRRLRPKIDDVNDTICFSEDKSDFGQVIDRKIVSSEIEIYNTTRDKDLMSLDTYSNDASAIQHSLMDVTSSESENEDNRLLGGLSTKHSQQGKAITSKKSLHGNTTEIDDDISELRFFS